MLELSPSCPLAISKTKILMYSIHCWAMRCDECGFLFLPSDGVTSDPLQGHVSFNKKTYYIYIARKLQRKCIRSTESSGQIEIGINHFPLLVVDVVHVLEPVQKMRGLGGMHTGWVGKLAPHRSLLCTSMPSCSCCNASQVAASSASCCARAAACLAHCFFESLLLFRDRRSRRSESILGTKSRMFCTMCFCVFPHSAFFPCSYLLRWSYNISPTFPRYKRISLTKPPFGC